MLWLFAYYHFYRKTEKNFLRTGGNSSHSRVPCGELLCRCGATFVCVIFMITAYFLHQEQVLEGAVVRFENKILGVRGLLFCTSFHVVSPR